MEWLEMIANFGGKYADYDIAKKTVKAQQEAQEAQRTYVAQRAYTDNASTLGTLMPAIVIAIVGFLVLKA